MNRKYTYIWVSLVILVFGIIFVPKIVDRLNTGSIVEIDRMSVDKGNSQTLAYVLYDGKKRKVPSFGFLDQDSVLVTDEDYLGKVFVVEFFFTRCPSICPIMTENLLVLQEEFKGREDFGIASFSITPQYDTPSVLKDYAAKHGIDDPDWHLMTGDREEIYRLANEGFNIYAEENEEAPGGFEHSGLFALIDRHGFMRSRTDSFGNPIVYYRGHITEAKGENGQGEKEQISILKADIKKLLKE
ncbi:MAG TPA: SCO family protein [Pricia sp.]|nr:SCO family protein [Pricia sp.]